MPYYAKDPKREHNFENHMNNTVFPSFLGFGVRGSSYSNFSASTEESQVVILGLDLQVLGDFLASPLGDRRPLRLYWGDIGVLFFRVRPWGSVFRGALTGTPDREPQEWSYGIVRTQVGKFLSYAYYILGFPRSGVPIDSL